MPLTPLAAEIRRLLQHREWSAADLARALNQTQGNVSRWTTGRVCPSLANLRRIADALGVPSTHLLAQIESSPTESGSALGEKSSAGT